MKIRLLADDSKMPNLAIMKIATYHKNKGDNVDWYNPIVDYLDTDILYHSRIFNFTPEYTYYPINCEIKRGGQGSIYIQNFLMKLKILLNLIILYILIVIILYCF